MCILKIFKKATGSLNRSNSFYFWQHVYEFEFFRSVYFIDPKRNRFMSDTGFMNEMTYGGIKSSDVLIKGHTNLSTPLTSEPATFVQRLPNVFQTPWTFGTRWVVWNALGSRCTNVAGRLEHVG